MKRKGTLLDFWSKRHKSEVSIDLFPSQLDENTSENNNPLSINIFQSSISQNDLQNAQNSDAPYQDSEDLFPSMELENDFFKYQC